MTVIDDIVLTMCCSVEPHRQSVTNALFVRMASLPVSEPCSKSEGLTVVLVLHAYKAHDIFWSKLHPFEPRLLA